MYNKELILKKLKGFRLSEEVLEMIDHLSKSSGKSQTQIVEEAVKSMFENKGNVDKEIELYKKENEQLKLVLTTFKQKEEAVNRLLTEKDERINDLQDIIKTLKEINTKKKPFWKFW